MFWWSREGRKGLPLPPFSPRRFRLGPELTRVPGNYWIGH